MINKLKKVLFTFCLVLFAVFGCFNDYSNNNLIYNINNIKFASGDIGSSDGEYALEEIEDDMYIDKLYIGNFSSTVINSSSSIIFTLSNEYVTLNMYTGDSSWGTYDCISLIGSSDLFSSFSQYILNTDLVTINGVLCFGGSSNKDSNRNVILYFKYPFLVSGLNSAYSSRYFGYPTLNGSGYTASNTGYANLQRQVITLSQQVTSLQSQVDSLTSTNSELSSQVSELQTKISLLQESYYHSIQSLNYGTSLFDSFCISALQLLSRDHGSIVVYESDISNWFYSDNSVNSDGTLSYFFKIPDEYANYQFYTVAIYYKSYTLNFTFGGYLDVWESDYDGIITMNITYSNSNGSNSSSLIKSNSVVSGSNTASLEFENTVYDISSCIVSLSTDYSYFYNSDLGRCMSFQAVLSENFAYNQGYTAAAQVYASQIKDLTNEYNSLLQEYQTYQETYNESSLIANYNKGFNEGATSGTPASIFTSLLGSIASVPGTILNSLEPFVIWDVPILSIILTFLFLALMLWLIRLFI